MMIQEIIGTGEIAISDHRSSQPTFEEFVRVAADTRLGGILSGKAGIINVHLGDGSGCMELIDRVIDETEIPASQFLPTHVNRNEMLFCKAIKYALKGGAVDFTGNEDIDYWETVRDEVRVCYGMKRMLEAGVNSHRITISSDGQGSLPVYNEKGEFQGMGVGQSSSLLKEVRECVNKAQIPLETALSAITSNLAEILCLKRKGRILEGIRCRLVHSGSGPAADGRDCKREKSALAPSIHPAFTVIACFVLIHPCISSFCEIMYAIPTLLRTKSIAMRNRHGVHQLAVPRGDAFVKGFQPVGKRSHFLSKYDYKFVAADPGRPCHEL